MENVADILTGKKSPESLGVKAIDPHTLQVTLTQPVPYLVDMLNHTSLKPVKKRLLKNMVSIGLARKTLSVMGRI